MHPRGYPNNNDDDNGNVSDDDDNDDADDDGDIKGGWVASTYLTFTFFCFSNAVHPILIIFDQSLTELRTMYIKSVDRA